MDTLRYAFEFWLFYLTNEGNSAVPIAKFVNIGTGCVAAGIAFLILWPIMRWMRRNAEAEVTGTEGTATHDAGGNGGTGEPPCNCYIAAGVTYAIVCTCMKNGIRANAPWGKWSAAHEGEAVRPKGWTP